MAGRVGPPPRRPGVVAPSAPAPRAPTGKRGGRPGESCQARRPATDASGTATGNGGSGGGGDASSVDGGTSTTGDGDPGEAQLALRRLSEGYREAELEEPTVEGERQPPVSVDDVVDMHEFLRDFDGDFQRLFRAS